jgi:rSAM/selenodomain-associated transferase 1
MSRARADACGIAVFARAPVAGAAKTRLIPLLGAEGAASLHAALVRRALAIAGRARDEGLGIGQVTLWCAPDASAPFFMACREEFTVGLRDQAEGDLGQRMHAAFEAERSPLLLIGADCPVLGPHLLRLCAARLFGGDEAVFLPAEDGGYALVGLARPCAAIFDAIAWGGPTVMEETRKRLREAGLAWSEPATVWDVDRPEDVKRLVESRLLPEWGVR